MREQPHRYLPDCTSLAPQKLSRSLEVLIGAFAVLYGLLIEAQGKLECLPNVLSDGVRKSKGCHTLPNLLESVADPLPLRRSEGGRKLLQVPLELLHLPSSQARGPRPRRTPARSAHYRLGYYRGGIRGG
jgi:hypothetical protein